MVVEKLGFLYVAILNDFSIWGRVLSIYSCSLVQCFSITAKFFALLFGVRKNDVMHYLCTKNYKVLLAKFSI